MGQDLREAQATVLREVGRNLLLYQYLERQLKDLLLAAEFTADMSKLRDALIERREMFQRHTMGRLSQSLLDTVFRGEPPQPALEEAESTAITEPQISFSFTIDSDAGYLAERQQVLATIVAQRNDLAHSFFLSNDLSTIERCDEALARLREQHRYALREWDQLRLTTQHFHYALNELARHLLSKDWPT